jgi:uncharacterized protein
MEQLHGYPGHEELELALMRLYRLTNAPEHLELARYFVEERGQRRDGVHYYESEAKQNGVSLWPGHFKSEKWFEYMQAGSPIRQQMAIEGLTPGRIKLIQATPFEHCISSAESAM